jgi:hypothetical protein
MIAGLPTRTNGCGQSGRHRQIWNCVCARARLDAVKKILGTRSARGDSEHNFARGQTVEVPRARPYSEITSAHWAQNDSPYLCPLNTESGECRLAIRMMSTGLLTLAPVY